MDIKAINNMYMGKAQVETVVSVLMRAQLDHKVDNDENKILNKFIAKLLNNGKSVK